MAKASKVRVIIADDHELVRKGLAFMLAWEHDIEVVGEGGSGPEAIALVDTQRPDVVLMDIKMPQMDGLEATRRISDQNPETAVILLSAYVDEDLVQEAAKAGAVGYLLKDASRELIADAIRTAHRGGLFLSRSLISSMAKGQKALFPLLVPMQEQKPARSRDAITPREQEVLNLLVHGLTNKRIGAKLFIGEQTVKKHVQRIIAKLGTNDRTEAAVKAVREGLVKAAAE